jgi:hypothetical protein
LIKTINEWWLTRSAVSSRRQRFFNSAAG